MNRFAPLPVAALTAALLLFASSQVFAQVSRLALVVGSNRGAAAAKSLRYAERDAVRFSGTLKELGGFKAADVHLLRQPNKATFLTGLETLNREIAARKKAGAAKVLGLVYFSGHANGVDLELGEERLSFTALRQAVESLGADVKILIMDSCQSGGVTAYKGGRPGPSFDIVLTDTIDANGTAVLTSSAAGEKSQESGRLKGSFFTHFLISGLSGAADFDQDSRVTLNEIYQYTYNKTVAETARTMGGTQHPSYDFRITGRGKVVLADLNRVAAVRFAPSLQGNFLILKEETNEIVAELTKPGGVPRKAALPPGRYRVALIKKRTVFAATIRLTEGEQVDLTERMLAPKPKLEGLAIKGEEAATKHRVGLSLSYGMLSGALHRYTVLHEGVVTLRADIRRLSFFPKFTIGTTRIDEDNFQYQLLLFTGEVGLARRFERSAVDLFLGGNVGGGYGRQELSDELRTGIFFIYGLLTGLEFPFSEHFLLSVFWEVGGQAYRAEKQLAHALLLRGSVGFGACF